METYKKDNLTIYNADCREYLDTLEKNSIDTILTDVPYNLANQPDFNDIMEAFGNGLSYYGSKGFMGKVWDSFIPGPDFTSRFLRVLKPGGFFISFMSPRTDYILKMALHKVGFKILESGVWLYGSDFPKCKTNIKSLMETIVFAQKPLEDGLTIAQNIEKWGTGGFTIEAGRIGGSGGTKKTVFDSDRVSNLTYVIPKDGKSEQLKKGRYPNNVFLTHSPECVDLGVKRVKSEKFNNREGGKFENINTYGKIKKETKLKSIQRNKESHYADADGFETVPNWQCVEGCPVRVIGEQGRETKTPDTSSRQGGGEKREVYGKGLIGKSGKIGFADTGTASRYFHNTAQPLYLYNGKATKGRHLGLTDFCWIIDKTKEVGYKRISKAEYNQAPKELRRKGNIHPTVKPFKLLEQLLKLTGRGVVLDPFMGSGGTGIAALNVEREFIGIDINIEYVEIAEARLDYFALLKQMGKTVDDIRVVDEVEVETGNGTYKQVGMF